MSSRKLLITLVCVASLVTTAVIVPAQRQVEIPQEVINQIRQRPKRIIAKPINFNLKDIVAEFSNQPDVDLRPKIKQMGIPIRSQGNRGTCSVFALTFLLEYMYAWRENYHTPDFSEEYLNYASNLAIGQYDDGGFFDALDLGYQKYGMVNESQAPYHSSYNPPYVAPPRLLKIGEQIEPRFKAHFIKPWNNQTGLTAGELKDIEQALNSGRPVATGVRWPNNFQTETVHGVALMKTPPPSGVFDGHSIDLVGYKASNAFPGGGYFIFRNSFGTGFGAEGYGFMSFEYANKYANDAVDYFKPGARD
ncbi:MAG TPA: C1 family peptidase [Pyrinomonadaceae bacterium]|jgi:C1A family cysteine protease|nr:C1 family peptidase [Pyrinomonadaceae bacterium]